MYSTLCHAHSKIYSVQSTVHFTLYSAALITHYPMPLPSPAMFKSLCLEGRAEYYSVSKELFTNYVMRQRGGGEGVDQKVIFNDEGGGGVRKKVIFHDRGGWGSGKKGFCMIRWAPLFQAPILIILGSLLSTGATLSSFYLFVEV